MPHEKRKWAEGESCLAPGRLHEPHEIRNGRILETIDYEKELEERAEQFLTLQRERDWLDPIDIEVIPESEIVETLREWLEILEEARQKGDTELMEIALENIKFFSQALGEDDE